MFHSQAPTKVPKYIGDTHRHADRVCGSDSGSKVKVGWGWSATRKNFKGSPAEEGKQSGVMNSGSVALKVYEDG